MLQEEGQLLSSVQGRDGVDYEIGAYASTLRALLERKLAATRDLLSRVTTFQQHLAIEEEVSSKINAKAMRV